MYAARIKPFPNARARHYLYWWGKGGWGLVSRSRILFSEILMGKRVIGEKTLLAFMVICLVIISVWPPFVSQIVVILVNRELTVRSVNWPQVSGRNSQNIQ